MNLIAKRRWWYAISLIIIVPGTLSLILHGLRLGIDFQGGQELLVRGQVAQSDIASVAGQLKLKDVTTISSGSDTLIRYRDEAAPATQEADHRAISGDLAGLGHPEVSFNTVGPSISSGITRNALISVALAAIATMT